MFESILPSGIDIERLGRTYVSMQRRRMAEAIADGSEGMTQVKARDQIIKMEDTVLDEIEGEYPDLAEPALRAMAQKALMDKLSQGREAEEA